MAVSPPVPVIVTAGADAWGPVQELRARPELRLVASPRHAAVLVEAGAVADQARAADLVHDQVPHPRATVTWRPRPVPGDDEVDALVEAVQRAHADRAADPVGSDPDRRPDEDPHEWRGVGPFGQGGEGMMGGTPYGRPMAMTGDDRDGLALDRLHLRLGPYLDPLPGPLVLDVVLQGDVLQSVDVAGAPPDPGPDEARHHLRLLAHGLHVHGLDALAARAAALAVAGGRGSDVADRGRRLARAVRRSGLLWALRGVGSLEGRGDAADRWRVRLEALGDGSLGDAVGPRRGVAPGDLGPLLEGQTLGGAIATLTSLDLVPLPEGAAP